MSTVPDPARDPSVERPRRAVRWTVIVAASALIHLALLDALPHRTVEPSDDELGAPLHATLAPLVPPTPPAAPTPPPVSTPRPAPKAPPSARATSRPKRPAIDEPPFVPESFEPPQPITVQAPGASSIDAAPPASASDPSTPAPPSNAPPSPASSPAPPPSAPPVPPTTPPQSARLDYAVVSQNVKEANPIYGRGTITWATADGRYATDLKAAADVFVFKFDVLSSHSEGAIGPGGLLPDRYLESPRKRATVATNFNRDARQSVTFSASPATVPLPPGAQDRLSVLFQIGALLLADPRKTAPGTSFEIPVAGVRGDVETWRFDVIGPETLDTGVGTLSTTHLRRAARPGTNDRTIDVWVAQSDGGYPARVLYTEPSGNTVAMTLDRITAMPP